MKKLSKKLVLSSLSLGLAVATLSTTTFAWYTNNTSVKAEGAQGTTAAGASAGLLISNAFGGTYSNSVTLVPNVLASEGVEAKTNDYVPANNLVPLEKKTSSSKQVLAELGATTTTASVGQYLQFSVYIKATADTTIPTDGVPVYLKSLTIANTKTKAQLAEKPFDIIKKDYVENAWAQETGDTADPTTYAVDAAQALNFSFVQRSLTTSTTKNDAIGETAYSVNTLVGTTKNSHVGTAADALGYYNAVMGAKLQRIKDQAAYNAIPEKDRPATGTYVLEDYATELKTGRAAAKTGETGVTPDIDSVEVVKIKTDVVEVTFTVWLDGWDKYCFDACKGQSFNFAVEFTTEQADVVVGTAKKPANTGKTE